MEAPSVRPLSLVSDGLGEEEWILEDRYGKCVPLVKTAMLFLGREECDILLKSKSVDGQHAVLVYDEFVERFKVKDLTSINGTFVNESRIPEDTYVYVDHADTLRFGYDSMVYRVLACSRLDTDSERSVPKAPDSVAKTNSPVLNSNKPRTAPSDDLPSWAAKEMEQMESPTSCLEDQLLLPGVLPPVMAECTACIAENRMECHDCEHMTPRPPSDNHSCGFFPSPLPANGFPSRTRQDPPRTLPLHTNNSAVKEERTPTEEAVALIEQLELQGPPDATTPVHRAASAGPLSPGTRRKSVRVVSELYGQPSWWGEDDGDVYSYPHTGSLSGQEKSVMPDPGKPPRSRVTPRDSLEPSRPSTADSQPPITPSRPAEAFTVVFEPDPAPEEEDAATSASETPPPSGQALSQFVPSKIRKSFQERQQERQLGSKRRQQKPPVDKTKSDVSASSVGPARTSTSAARASGRPSTAIASRYVKPASRPTTASARLDVGTAAAKKPPISKQRPSPLLTRSVDSTTSSTAKRTAGQPTSTSPRVTTTRPSPLPKKKITLRKSGSTDKLKSSSNISIDSLKSYGDTKSYLFDKMFDSSYSKPVSSPPLLPHDSNKPRSSPGRSPAACDDRISSPPRDNDQASDAGTYTIERESKEYEEARKVDLSDLPVDLESRGRADGREASGRYSNGVTPTKPAPDEREEKSEVEKMEKEEVETKEEKMVEMEDLEDDEDEMDEPLSVCEMTDITGMDEVEQEMYFSCIF